MSNISKLDANDVELILRVMEDVTRSSTSIKSIMKKHAITFEEYCVISDLAMPLIRVTNNQYKGQQGWKSSSRPEHDEGHW